MISNCVGCGIVIAKYAPLDEVRRELCPACVERQHQAEKATLSCGELECVYPQVSYECLHRAAGDGSVDCPAQRDQVGTSA